MLFLFKRSTDKNNSSQQENLWTENFQTELVNVEPTAEMLLSLTLTH